MGNHSIFYATGDIGPSRDNPHAIFRHVNSILRNGDLVFGQMETNLSSKGTPSPQARLPMRADPSGAAAIRDAGFNVMSFAGNHCLDWGARALGDTLDTLKGEGIQVCGAGNDIIESRTPIIVTTGDTSVAFLAYSSVLPESYWATESRPGCAPMRAHTIYDQTEYEQPGSPANTHTFPHREDKAALLQGIAQAKAQADIVIVSMHWGIHFIPGVIAGYQRELAHSMIDTGADMIIGHHPHIIKGVDFYAGKPIFYSLGNFAIEQPSAFSNSLKQDCGFQDIQALNPNWDTDRKYMAPPDTRKTFIVNCNLSKQGISDLKIILCHINEESEPEVLSFENPLHRETLIYLDKITRDQGFSTKFKIENKEISVLPG